MTLEPLNVSPVNPGEPITAQAWNQIVDNLKSVITAVNSQAGQGLRVQLSNTDIDLDEVRISAVATADGGAVFEAAAPVAPDTAFVLTGMPPGEYLIHATAPSYPPATERVKVPDQGELRLTLTGGAPVMPEIFGRTLEEALSELRGRGIVVDRIVDITGQDVAPANPGADFASAKVLMHLPASGDPAPARPGVQIVISGALKVEPSVEVPSLNGLTLKEVQDVLDGLGLVLGNVDSRTEK